MAEEQSNRRPRPGTPQPFRTIRRSFFLSGRGVGDAPFATAGRQAKAIGQKLQPPKLRAN